MRKIILITMTIAMLISACGSQRKQQHYSELYHEEPAVIYVAPLVDLSSRHALRTTEDSLYNLSLNAAAKHLYLTASDPLVSKGYYLPGPLASAQLAATEYRTGRQLRNEDISDYHSLLGVDAILFITLHQWKNTTNSWTAEVEYVLRSTLTGNEIMHVSVNAMKILPTDFKGNPILLRDDREFADKYGCDDETAARCRLLETLNIYVLKDLPSGFRARHHDSEQYTPSHPEYFNLKIHTDGSVEMLKTELYD